MGAGVTDCDVHPSTTPGCVVEIDCGVLVFAWATVVQACAGERASCGGESKRNTAPAMHLI